MTARISVHTWLWPALMAIVATLLGIVAVISPSLALAAAAAAAFVTVAVADLTAGVALFVFVSFLEVLPGVGGLSAAKLAGAVLVLSYLAASATSHRRREQLSQVHPGLLGLTAVFLAWIALGALWAESSPTVLSSLIRYAPNLMLFPIVFEAARSGRDIRIILLAFVAGALVSTAYGAFIAPGDPDAAAEGRVTGAGIDPNVLAASLVAGLALCGGATLTRAFPAGVRVAAGAAGAILLVALVLTASRTGITALLGASAVATLMAGRRRRLPAAAVVAIVLALGAGYITQVAPPAVRSRLQDVGSGGGGRTDLWVIGLRMVQAHPVNGVGAGNFPVSSVHYLLEPGQIKRDDFVVNSPKVAHNVYLEIWAELGIIGLVMFLAIVGFAVGCGVRAAHTFQRAGRRDMEMLSRSVVVATAGLLTAAIFVSLEYDKPIWLLLALCPCLLALSRKGTPPG